MQAFKGKNDSIDSRHRVARHTNPDSHHADVFCHPGAGRRLPACGVYLNQDTRLYIYRSRGTEMYWNIQTPAYAALPFSGSRDSPSSLYFCKCMCFSNYTILPLYRPADPAKPCLSCTKWVDQSYQENIFLILHSQTILSRPEAVHLQGRQSGRR